MKKFVMVLAILCMGGAILLSVLNRNEALALKERTDEIKQEIRSVSDQITETEAQLVEAEQERDKATTSKNETGAKLSEKKEELKRNLAMIQTTQEALAEADIKKKEYDIILNRFKEKGIDGIDDLIALEEGKKKAVADAEADLSAAETKLEEIQQKTTVAEAEVTEHKQNQIRYATNVALNGLEATVIAVNPDWGFVMVNVGENLGITESVSLLVKRGEERVARLQVREVRPSMLVADVIPGSLNEGDQVQPGDKVILESTN